MPTFSNQATLTYNGITTTSNITTGEIIQVLSATKSAVLDNYTLGDDITFVINIVNSGATPYNNLTITDNLGAYNLGDNTVTPLTYVEDSLNYYVNGVVTPIQSPAIIDDQLVLTPISIPANSNATIIYEASANQYAPLALGSGITNTAIITSPNLAAPIEISAQVSPFANASLTISKSVSPAVVAENGELTYTFILQNSGNAAATEDDNVQITDTFNPVLTSLNVTFNDSVWEEGVQYTYDEATGDFATLAGIITVPSATYSQSITTGAYTINPGVATLKVRGLI